MFPGSNDYQRGIREDIPLQDSMADGRKGSSAYVTDRKLSSNGLQRVLKQPDPSFSFFTSSVVVEKFVNGAARMVDNGKVHALALLTMFNYFAEAQGNLGQSMRLSCWCLIRSQIFLRRNMEESRCRLKENRGVKYNLPFSDRFRCFLETDGGPCRGGKVSKINLSIPVNVMSRKIVV